MIKMKKSIGLLAPSMNSGGAERVISRLSHILENKYKVYVILFEDTYMTYDCGGTIINMGIPSQTKKEYRRLLLPIKRSIKLKNIKKIHDLDIVISFMDSPNIVNLLSHTKRCKSVISIRNYSFRRENKLINIIKRLLYTRADKVICVSNVIQRKTIKDYNLQENKVVTVYNPYDTNQIETLAKEDIVKEYENFFKDGRVFISVGRNVYQKGFWHLIKAFKLVNNEYPTSKLVIIGRDESGGKALKLVEDLGLCKNVLLIGYQKNPFKYISRSSVYVLSSLFEGFPNSLVEAMACGCPVIATDCDSGPREILNDTHHLEKSISAIQEVDYGILVPSLEEEENWQSDIITEREETLAQGMLLYIKNNELREYYSKQVQERARTFDYEKCLQGFEEIINE
jgi:glycosyltransferase involved in cell wall biosynthesis